MRGLLAKQMRSLVEQCSRPRPSPTEEGSGDGCFDGVLCIVLSIIILSNIFIFYPHPPKPFSLIICIPFKMATSLSATVFALMSGYAISLQGTKQTLGSAV